MYTTQTFIDKAQQIHNNKYNYTKTVYKSWAEKLFIIYNVNNSID